MAKATKFLIKALACLIAFFIVFGMMRFPSWDYNNNNKRVEWTIISLHGARGGVKVFEKRNERFPNSLEELINYAGKNPEASIYDGPIQEFLSDEKGNQSESKVFDGSGGVYYNNITGEVRVNLTKPVKCYLKYYFKRDRNDIPSEW